MVHVGPRVDCEAHASVHRMGATAHHWTLGIGGAFAPVVEQRTSDLQQVVGTSVEPAETSRPVPNARKDIVAARERTSEPEDLGCGHLDPLVAAVGATPGAGGLRSVGKLDRQEPLGQRIHTAGHVVHDHQRIDPAKERGGHLSPRLGARASILAPIDGRRGRSRATGSNGHRATVAGRQGANQPGDGGRDPMKDPTEPRPRAARARAAHPG